MLYYCEPGGSLFKISDQLCYGWCGYYDYCILENDGTFTFGTEATRQGGVTLSSSWCNVEDGRTLRPATAEEYRQAVKDQLKHIRKCNLDFYSYIFSYATDLHRAFLSGADFDYKYSKIIAEMQAKRKERREKQRENDKIIELQNRSFYSTPVKAVFDFSTREFKEL